MQLHAFLYQEIVLSAERLEKPKPTQQCLNQSGTVATSPCLDILDAIYPRDLSKTLDSTTIL